MRLYNSLFASLLLVGVCSLALGQERPSYFEGQQLEEKDLADVDGTKQSDKADTEILIVANSGIEAVLQAKQKARLQGRLNLALIASPQDTARGRIRVHSANLLLQQVDQRLLIDRKGSGNPRAVVGFRIFPNSPEGPAFLNYTQKTQTIEGTLNGAIDFPWLAEASIGLQVKRAGDPSEQNDFYVADAQKGQLSIKLAFEKPLPTDMTKIAKAPANIQINLKGMDHRDFGVRKYAAEIRWSPITFSVVGRSRYEIVNSLCVQPVFFSLDGDDPQTTGRGFPFGRPGAINEWSKADVVFQFKQPLIIVDDDVRTIANLDEAWALRSTVEDGACVEVYFLEAFSPSRLFGGGVAFSAGSASAFVVSSDENANRIDFTHLAHELGHTMGLAHPGDGYPNADHPNVEDGTYGTLLCPSGFARDNPRVNSEENRRNVGTPLFETLIRAIRPGVDCINIADCGRCP